MENILKRVQELTTILEKANYDYYVLDNPTLEDWQFDSYMQELLSLEKDYPQYAFPTSPTKRVGGTVASQFIKVTHKKAMLRNKAISNAERVSNKQRLNQFLKRKGK
jgi:DNA ligase (NAD+)